MKKMMLTVLTVLSCGAAYSLPVGNTADPVLYTNGLCWSGSSCYDPCGSSMRWCDLFSIRVGFYGDYVFNRHLEVSARNVSQSNIDVTEIYTNAASLALNMCDWLDCFATLGATDISIFTNGSSLASSISPADATMIDIDFDTRFSWSIGLRAVPFTCKNFQFGFEGQYFRTKTAVDSVVRLESGDITYFNANNTTVWQEWQVGFGLSYIVSTMCPGVSFVPYMGLKLAGGKLDMGNMQFLFQGTATDNYTFYNLKPKKLWGYAVGMTATVCDAVGVTVEGRFADEKAIHVNGQFRF